MKLLIQGDRIAGTATDAYTGPMEFIDLSEVFDESKLSQYRLIDGEWVIPVPSSITMRQCRLQLLAIDKLDDVDTAIAAIPDAAARRAAEIEWEYAATVLRSSSWVQTLGAALGLTEAELDDLFIAAAAL